jgi:hypothetical protein
MTQVGEHPPHKRKALTSNPIIAKRKEEKKTMINIFHVTM